ncbi:sensor histidine kinase [Paenibacillus hamazuiensis]|uniref:sensor histidine kinase n=1 Tax=Paenibacillus hamazuiensis TaxID=2936508 RepID=UPI00200DD474|nr:histidine kinase [Paenibacillus hamazuiensis]
MEVVSRLFVSINRSFKIKLILSLSCIILLSSGIAGYLTYQNSMDLLKDEIGKQYLRTNEDAMAKLELNVQEIYRISQAIVFNPLIENRIKSIDAMTSVGDPYALYADKKQIEDQLYQIKLDAPYITGMYLYDLKGIPSYFSFNTSVIKPLDRDVYAKIRSRINETSGDLLWMSLPLPSSMEPSGYRQSVIAARLMKNSLLQTYGMLVITIDESFFAKSFKGLLKDDADEVFLYNPVHELIYSSTSWGAEILPDLQDANDAGGLYFVNDQIYAQSRSAAYSFQLLSATSLEGVHQKNRSISRQIVYSGLISVMLSSVLIVLSTGNLLRPLKQLVKGLHKVRNGDFKTRIVVSTKDELAYIGDSFNAMTEQVERLIREVYATQLSEREAQLQSIQAQLNPHFLHNLFNEIYWKLILQNQKETAALIKSVSETMNYSLMPVRSFTTVREELEHLKHYLKLQAELFESDLQISIRIDEDAMDGIMLRFLLQPLVENVFVHAFRNKTADKAFGLRVWKAEGELKIEVSDNGDGIDEERLSQIMNSDYGGMPVRQRAQRRESLGIRSVRKRIELVYGPPYGLHIESAPDAGTRIRLSLPYEEYRSGGEEVAGR